MKLRYLFLLCFIPVLSVAQPFKYTLKGKVGAYSSPARMFLSYAFPGKGIVIDSAIMVNGNFEFKGALDMPVNATLILKKTSAKVLLSKISEDNMLQLYLEPGIIDINGAGSLSSSKITAGKLNVDYNQYIRGITPVVDQIKAALKSFSIEHKITADQATGKIDSLMPLYDQSHQDFIAAHLNSQVSIYALESYTANDKNIDQAAILFDQLAKEVKESRRAIDFRQSLSGKINAVNSQKPTNIGNLAPDFEQPDVFGHKVTLSQFKGKYIFLDFWASWCKPCRAENPNIVEAYRKFREKGLEVIGVSLDGINQKKAWLNAIKTDGLPWTQVSDLKAWGNSAVLIYGVKALPENYLIDPSGKIIAKNLRGDQLLIILSKIFKK